MPNTTMTAICSELRVDKEFAAIMPDVTPEEMNLLEASLNTEGCRDPIIVWANHDDTILDGHRRYAICTRFKIPFKVKALKFETWEQARKWVIDTALQRRNLKEEQKKFLRGKRYVAEKTDIPNPEGAGGRSRKIVKGQNDPQQTTADRLAKEYGVSAPTIKRDAAFAKAIDKIEETLGPEAKQEILAGKCKLGSAAIIEAAELPPKKMAKALESGRLPVQNPKASCALDYAEFAILQLERILPNDPQKDAALRHIIAWCEERLDKAGGAV